MMSVLAGKVALVTGARSALGAQIAEVLLGEGLHVVVADVRGSAAESVAQRLGGADRGVLPLTLHVGDPQAVQGAVEKTVAQFGGLDVVVNNAGTDLTAPAEEISPDDWSFLLTFPENTVVPEMLVLPRLESSWP